MNALKNVWKNLAMKAWILTLTACIAAPPAATSPDESGTGELGTGELERHRFGDTELIYLRRAEGVHTIETVHPFDHVALHVNGAGGELRALDVDGAVVVDWTDVSTLNDDSDPAAFEGTVVMERPAHTLEFRAHPTVDFARFELGPGEPHHHEPDSTNVDADHVLFAAKPGRWIPPADVLAIANQQYLSYSGAPSSCAGTFLPGTRAIANFLRAEFVGATSYGGYACRANTANTSQLSVHASGRAIDLFVPLDGGEADNDLGDPIAHYLIEHAEELGIEFIVWDRTSWGAHRSAPKHRAYTGPHPHHDHLHIEVAPAVARSSNPTIPPVDRSPIGYLDQASCDGGITGWSQDPDAPDAPVQVYVSIGGPVFTEGAHGYWLTADNRRADLCDAIGSCDHGFSMPTPYGLMDGEAREVYVYGEDRTGGRNSELKNAPMTLQCDPPELPFGPEYGVLRHIPNPETLERWGFDWNGIVTIDDALVDEFPKLEPLPEAPTLQQSPEDPAVYLVEDNVRRHVTSGASLKMWGFSRDAIVETDTSVLLTGAPLLPRPFLVRGSETAVYILTPPPPAWATNFAWNAVDRVGMGQTARAELTLFNRGSATWDPADFEIIDSDAVLPEPVAPGESVELVIELDAPQQVGPAEFCFELAYQGHPFRESPPCVTIDVVEEQLSEDDLGAPSGSGGDDLAGGGGGGGPGADVVGQGSCATAGATPVWGLLLLALIAVRRRR